MQHLFVGETDYYTLAVQGARHLTGSLGTNSFITNFRRKQPITLRLETQPWPWVDSTFPTQNTFFTLCINNIRAITCQLMTPAWWFSPQMLYSLYTGNWRNYKKYIASHSLVKTPRSLFNSTVKCIWFQNPCSLKALNLALIEWADLDANLFVVLATPCGTSVEHSFVTLWTRIRHAKSQGCCGEWRSERASWALGPRSLSLSSHPSYAGNRSGVGVSATITMVID